MKTNETALDRVVRVVLGVVLLALVFVGPHTAWGWLGLVPLITGAVGFCPLYRVFRGSPGSATPACCGGSHHQGA
jgi:hypothetical protein